ncbi:MAG TPA: hypothetical protein VJ998_10815, partial [Pseudomonadales bacterium]|nr:hypothetical protein [Pseudomonadales bacterium]
MGNSFIPAYEQFYGQRFDKKRSAVEKFLRNGVHKVTSSVTTRKSRVKGFVARVNRFAESAEFDVSNEELARALRVEARRNGISDEYTARAFALIRRVAEQQLGMRHFDVQLIGGWAMMNGMVAEMDTGQGKTLTATLAAGAAALAGFPTHVITVNEYLASRDAEWMAPVYEALGLTVGVVTNEMPAAEKQEAYRRDVAYCTNKQIAFDYLRDRIEIGKSAGTR